MAHGKWEKKIRKRKIQLYILVRLLYIPYIFYLFFLYYLYKNLSSPIISRGKQGRKGKTIAKRQYIRFVIFRLVAGLVSVSLLAFDLILFLHIFGSVFCLFFFLSIMHWITDYIRSLTICVCGLYIHILYNVCIWVDVWWNF